MFKKILNFIINSIGYICLFMGLIFLCAILAPFLIPLIAVALVIVLSSILTVLVVILALFVAFWWLIIPLILIYFGGKLIGSWD